MPEDRTAADRPVRRELPREVRLYIEGLERRFLRGEPPREVITPLRRQTIRHIEAESVGCLAAGRVVVDEGVRNVFGGHVSVVLPERRVLREAAFHRDRGIF